LQTSKNSILTLILSLLSLLLFLCLNLFKRNIKLLQAGRESEEVVRVQPYLCWMFWRACRPLSSRSRTVYARRWLAECRWNRVDEALTPSDSPSSRSRWLLTRYVASRVPLRPVTNMNTFIHQSMVDKRQRNYVQQTIKYKLS